MSTSVRFTQILTALAMTASLAACKAYLFTAGGASRPIFANLIMFKEWIQQTVDGLQGHREEKD